MRSEGSRFTNTIQAAGHGPGCCSGAHTQRCVYTCMRVRLPWVALSGSHRPFRGGMRCGSPPTPPAISGRCSSCHCTTSARAPPQYFGYCGLSREVWRRAAASSQPSRRPRSRIRECTCRSRRTSPFLHRGLGDALRALKRFGERVDLTLHLIESRLESLDARRVLRLECAAIATPSRWAVHGGWAVLAAPAAAGTRRR